MLIQLNLDLIPILMQHNASRRKTKIIDAVFVDLREIHSTRIKY